MDSELPGTGVIEGFYGRPWSHPERLGMLDELARLRLSTSLFAPKDYAPLRTGWRDPWPPGELERLGELAERARARGIRLIAGISPVGNGRRLSPALARRVDELAGAGIEELAVLFDDTLATALPLAGRRIGAGHAELALRVAERAGRPPLVVPACYFGTWSGMGPGRRAYWRGLATVGERCPVAWTGPRIFSERIRGRDRRAIEEATGLRLWVWSNEHANDWLPLATGRRWGLRGWSKIAFGPVTSLAADAGPVLLNGALEPRLTRLSLASLAAWQGGEDPVRAFQEATRQAGGEAALRLHDLVRRHPLVDRGGDESGLLTRHVASWQPDGARHAGPLAELLRTLSDDARALRDSELGPDLLPTLERLELLAAAGLARLAGSTAERRRLLSRADRHRALVGRGSWRSLLR